MNFFTKNLKYLTKTKLNQNQLALKLDINRQNITKWLNDREPKFDILIQISKIYNVTIDDLLLKDLEKGNNKMKCLFDKTPKEFLKDLKDLVSEWYVRRANIEERYNAIKDTPKFFAFKSKAKNKLKFDNKELISWLDSMSQLYYIFLKLNEKKETKDTLFKNMSIIAEYQIPFTKNRIDYCIVKDNKILLLEFSYSEDNTKDHFKKKLNQLVYYKELLETSLDTNIKISLFTFLIQPEEIDWKTPIYKKSKITNEKTNPNYDQCNYLEQLIIHTFSNTQKNAYEQLNLMSEDFYCK